MRQPEFRIDTGFFIRTIWRKIFAVPKVQPQQDLQSRLESLLAAKILIILKDGEQGKTFLQNRKMAIRIMNSQHDQSMSDIVQKIGKLAVVQQQLAHQAEQQYSFEVEAILQEKCRDSQRIESLLDGMLDFCFDGEMLRLYKKLCRYYYKINPMATVSYVQVYREMWDEEDD